MVETAVSVLVVVFVAFVVFVVLATDVEDVSLLWTLVVVPIVDVFVDSPASVPA